MSIPPLVCSTPPPPDQCEDENPVDFDLQYSLSQDDDENNDYDYGNFSTYSHFQSSISSIKKEKLEPPLTGNSSEIENENNKVFEKIKDISEIIVERDNKTEILSKNEEDINIEDLNLKIDEESLDSNKKNNDVSDCVMEIDTNIPDIPIDTNDNVNDHINKPKNANKHDLNDDETDDQSTNKPESSFKIIKNPCDREENLDVESASYGKPISEVINESKNITENDFEDFVQSDTHARKITDESINILQNMADSNSQDISKNDTKQIKKIESTDILKDVTENHFTAHNQEFIERNEHNMTTGTISELETDISNDFEHFTKHGKEHVNELENVTDNDFEDFDSFCVTADIKPTNIISHFDNPWNNDKTSDPEFGEFKANFNDNDANLDNPTSILDDRSKINQCQEGTDPNICEVEDDFGEFDDFKSSAIETKEKEFETDSISCHQVPVLNLQSSDNETQVLGTINQVLSSIFQHEISVPESEFEIKLESLLCETWGHLIEIDVRQPYIVNWNNSLGQKTLLKALCIDSRNILFGPRWSYNMPKYAANLSAAPLQPQKHSSSNTFQNEDVNSEKPIKSLDTWTDPFSSDGQEFTYAEALLLDLEHLMATLDQMAHNHSTLKISELLSHACSTNNGSAVTEARQTNLDVFEAGASPKSDKIFSNSINVQPIRQINLPDTHIFTPTNSETPRSKTIHYDNVPAIVVPQSAVENDQNDQKSEQSVDDVSNPENDNEYSDFQDFQGTVEKSSTSASANQQPLQKPVENHTPKDSIIPNADVIIQTQILQPIKVEPVMPSLNWPDPGEVKEVFDDFSDFISNSSWNKDKQNLPHISVIHTDPSSIDTDSKVHNTNVNDVTTHVDGSPQINANVDDEFDTFQSALPSATTVSTLDNFNSFTNTNFSTHTENNTPPIPSHNIDFVNPHTNSIKTDPISFTHTINSNEILKQSSMHLDFNDPNHILRPAAKSSLQSPEIQMISTNMLRPTNVNTNVTQYQQNTAQILQPLSLESYSQINWPNPGIDLQDLSRFNPIESLQSLKNDTTSGPSKVASPVHNHKTPSHNQLSDEDIWGEFVSSKPKQQVPPKKPKTFNDDDEWTDFVSSPSIKPQNGLNTISLNVHTNLNMKKSTNQKKFMMGSNQISLDIPTLNYITPKSSSHNSYDDKHFQNL